MNPQRRLNRSYFIVRDDGGEGGIRTHGTVPRSQHFQCCQFNHSCTSPKPRQKVKVKRQKPKRPLLRTRPAFPFCLLPFYFFLRSYGGEGGIRTHGGRKPTPVFETGALIHYATSPRSSKKVKVKRQSKTNRNGRALS